MRFNKKTNKYKISRLGAIIRLAAVFSIIFAGVFGGKFWQSYAQNANSSDHELAETITRLTNRSTEGLVEEIISVGGYKIDLQDRFQHLMIARREANGEIEAACVTGLGEANSFFGRNLKTGELIPNASYQLEKTSDNSFLSSAARLHGMSDYEFEFYLNLIREAEQRQSSNLGGVTINIVNNDGAGEGFNDPASRSAEGGNAGTTLGQQRLNVFNHAAGIWGAFLDSNVSININSKFDPISPCSSSGGTLGFAGPTTGYRDFPNAQFAGTFYPYALANKLAGSDLDTNTNEINATFNSSVDNGCLGGGSRFYYGLNNSTPSSTINLLIVVLHEMGHGLGFLSFVNGSTGELASGFPDIYTRFMFDRSVNLYWHQMTNAQRQASALNNGNVLWDGPNVKIASGFLTAGRDAATGRVQLYTPPTLEGGSSISHFDKATFPNLLMEPTINLGLPIDLDLTRQQMRDIGWYRDTNVDLTPDTITNVQPSGNSITVGANINVMWTNNGGFNRNVTIELSTDGGATFPVTIASNISNTGSHSFTVPNNPTSQGRIRVREHSFVQPSGVSSANVTISSGGNCAYSINPTSIDAAASGGTGSTSVTTSSGCAWTAVSNANWITVTSGASGNGNGTVGYSVQANTGAARSGTITIAGQTFTVNQAAGSTSCPPASNISIGQTVNGTLQSGDCLYTDQSFYDAYTFSGTAGQQVFIAMNSTQFNAYLFLYQGNYPGGTFVAQDNNGGGGTNARIPATSGFVTLPATGTYTILANSNAAGETGSYSLTLGTSCSYSISPTSANLAASGGTGSTSVATSSGCAWSATSNDSWITITGGANGSGNGTVSYSVAANSSTTQRTGTITIAGQTFTVTQAGAVSCSYSINPTSQSFSASGGTGSTNLTVATGCTWSATSNNSWITVTSGASGNGNGTVGYSVQTNTAAARTGTITIGGQTLTVTQAAGSTNNPCNTSQPVSFGQTVSGSLATSDCQFSDGSYVDFYSFSGTQGQLIAISMSASFDTYLLLYNASGQVIDFDDDGGDGTNSRIPAENSFLALPSTGTYFIGANSFEANVTGSYTLSLTQNSSTSRNRKTVGVFRPSNGITYMRNSNTGGFADISMIYGVAGDQSFAGDWNGDRIDSIGIYRNGVFYLRNSNSTGAADVVFAFGAPGDQPVAGDWNGDGIDTIGVYRPTTGVFMLRNSNTAGAPDVTFVLGNPGDVAIAGDWNGDGITTTGVFRPTNGIVYLKNANTSGDADIYLVYGVAGDKPVAGDWDGDGQDSIGIYREGVFYLRNSNTQGVADIVFALGNPGDEPIAGDWDGLP